MADDAWVKIKQHWCLTEGRDRVVPETDPEARWLHWKPGDLVKREDAERLGAVEPEAKPAPEPKKAPPAANKARPPTQNKGR